MAKRSINKGIRVQRTATHTTVKIGWPVIIVVLALIIWACNA
jgi:hypothetical protein